jgi:acyl-CoA dehydrogenase
MEFAFDAGTEDFRESLLGFIGSHVYPAEPVFHAQLGRLEDKWAWDNCAAPDTGKMEVLSLFGSEQQRKEWLEPLLEGRVRSSFAMSEHDVASSDAANIATRIERDGDEYAVNGRKWGITGAMNPNAKVFIVMGKSDPSAARHRQQSMILVPRYARARDPSWHGGPG